MRTFIALVLVTIVLGLFGAAALGVARLEGHIADAQQQLATLQYDAAKTVLPKRRNTPTTRAGAVPRTR
jgi:hypothetical protein